MRHRVQGFSSVTAAYGISILMNLYDYIGRYGNLTIKFIENQRDFIGYIVLFLFAYGFFRIGWTARTKGRIAAVLAGTLNGLLIADMVMEWGIGEFFGIAITLCLLIYLIWGQEKQVWIPTLIMAMFSIAYYLGIYMNISVLNNHSELLLALSQISAVTALSAVDEY